VKFGKLEDQQCKSSTYNFPKYFVAFLEVRLVLTLESISAVVTDTPSLESGAILEILPFTWRLPKIDRQCRFHGSFRRSIRKLNPRNKQNQSREAWVHSPIIIVDN
jgi:hypothetical protein